MRNVCAEFLIPELRIQRCPCIGAGGEFLQTLTDLKSRLLAFFASLVWVRDDDDAMADMNVGHWVGLVIGAVVLLIVIAALFPQLTKALTSYKGNETTFGPILFTIVPILVGVGILLAFVYSFLPKKGMGHK
jgi:hypothetical protein